MRLSEVVNANKLRGTDFGFPQGQRSNGSVESKEREGHPTTSINSSQGDFHKLGTPKSFGVNELFNNKLQLNKGFVNECFSGTSSLHFLPLDKSEQ